MRGLGGMWKEDEEREWNAMSFDVTEKKHMAWCREEVSDQKIR